MGQMGRSSSRHPFPVTRLDGRRSWRIQDIVGLMFVNVHRGRMFILPKRGETFLLRLNTCSVTQSCPTLCGPMDCSVPGSSVHGISQQEYWNGLSCPPGELPNPGITPESPAFQADPLPTEPPGKPQTQRRR